MRESRREDESGQERERHVGGNVVGERPLARADHERDARRGREREEPEPGPGSQRRCSLRRSRRSRSGRALET
jgi:hypothetical protein